MKDNPHREEREEMKELLLKYQKLKSGSDFQFLEEESFERIIDYYDEQDQLNSALEAADCGIRQFPYSSLLLIKKADLLIASHSFHDALDFLERASVLDQSDINLYILKADAWLGLGDKEKAITIFHDALLMLEGVEKMEFLFDMADVFDDYEMFEEVFECLKAILLQDGQNEEALFKICFWTDYTLKFEESIALHQQLIEEHPYNHIAWFNLGTAFQGLKLYEKAIDAYLYSIAIDEKFDYAYRNLGDAYIRIKNYREAIDSLEKVLELSIPEDVIYEALGYCYEKIKEPAQARANYRKALHMNPEDSHLMYKIGLTYKMEEKFAHAINQFEQALRIQPSNADFHFAIGQCYSETDSWNEALNAFIHYITQRPSSMKGWKEIVALLFRNGYYEDALRECETAIKLTKGKPVFNYYKAAICLKMGKKQEALLILENALREAPKLLKEFTSLDPSFLQRASVVRVINAHLTRKDKSNKKRK